MGENEAESEAEHGLVGKYLHRFFGRSWKTTAAAIVVGGSSAMQVIEEGMPTTGAGWAKLTAQLGIAFGFAFAKDHNISGGKKA
jgi:hypothetical protein